MRFAQTAPIIGVLAAIALSGCGLLPVELSPDTAGPAPTVFYRPLEETGRVQEFLYSIDVGSAPRDVYLVFGNPTSGSLGSPEVEVRSVQGGETSQQSVSGRSLSSVPVTPDGAAAVRGNPEIRDWEPSPTARSAGRPPGAVPTPDNYVPTGPAPSGSYTTVANDPGTTHDFYYDSASGPIPAVLATRVADVPTAHGVNKTLEIWVAAAEWESGNTFEITQVMTDALAEQFLSASATDDDVFDWVSSVFGQEWFPSGSEPGSIDGFPVIDGHDTITILLYPIRIFEDDAGPGGVVGFFWSKDNYTDQTSSNQRVMFYIDSETFGANSGFAWEITDFWPNDMVFTLAHELQHMVHFHERAAAQGARTETWVNEMMSLAAEDLIERKMGTRGPRGVDPAIFTSGDAGPANNQFGRVPYYNVGVETSLGNWGAEGEILATYGAAYSIGAYLARNYGGARLLEELARNGSSSSESMLTDAIFASSGTSGMTLGQILVEWGASTLLSDRTDAPTGMRLNTGGWLATSTSDGSGYDLGSVDHFRYDPSLTLPIASGLRLISVEPMAPVSKRIVPVGIGVTGTVDLAIRVAPGTALAAVVK